MSDDKQLDAALVAALSVPQFAPLARHISVLREKVDGMRAELFAMRRDRQSERKADAYAEKRSAAARELAYLRAENERLRKRDDAITFDFQSLCDVIACKSPECGDLLCGACDVVDRLARTDAELADLRAYKERTEAGLVDLSGAVTLNNRTPDDGSHHAFLLNTITWKMRRNGLWRDPPQAEVQT